MEFLFLAGGVVIGAVMRIPFDRRTKTHGIIEVDHDTAQCKVRITSKELADRKTKKAIFIIDHDATISREEHIL